MKPFQSVGGETVIKSTSKINIFVNLDMITRVQISKHTLNIFCLKANKSAKLGDTLTLVPCKCAFKIGSVVLYT